MRARWVLVASAGAVVALGVACGDSATAPGRAVTLDVVAGDQQTAPPNTELPQPLVVRVTDASGQPVEGQIVNFRVTAGGGSMFAGAGSTNAQGTVQDRWTLGPGGIQTAEARAVDNTTGAPIVFGTFTATVTNSPSAPTIRTVGDGLIVATVGTHVSQPVVFLAKDQSGAPVPHFTFTLRSMTAHSVNGDYCTSDSGDDQLAGPTLTTGPDGTVTFTGWTVSSRRGLKCLGVFLGTTEPQFRDDVGVWQVWAFAAPGPPAQLVRQGQDHQQAPAGTTLVSLGVIVEDQYGNVIGCAYQTTAQCVDPNAPEASVTFTPSAGGQVSTAQATTERGVAYTDWTIATGANTLTITVGSLSISYSATGT